MPEIPDDVLAAAASALGFEPDTDGWDDAVDMMRIAIAAALPVYRRAVLHEAATAVAAWPAAAYRLHLLAEEADRAR